MGNKRQRLLAIRNIISKEKIANQEELLARLQEIGFNLTQATLSRDLKFLQVGKIPDKDKKYILILPEELKHSDEYLLNGMNGNGNFPVNGFLSLKFANNFGVIRTVPGYASSIASMIDRAGNFEILGTIAGDDTILLIPNEGVTSQDLRNILVMILPELEEVI
jgi:transcriptional regulator of arginine metabolism